MAYATPAELEDFLGHPVDHAERMLERATRRIRGALLTARYDPTDSDVVAALRDATLEVCAYWDAQGMDGSEGAADGPSAYQSVTAGSISLTRATGGTGGTVSASGRAASAAGLPEQAWLVLRQAGLLGHPPRVGWY